MMNCVICSEESGTLIWRGDDCRVVLVSDPDLPGFCRVIWNRHVAEMSQLSHGERDLLMHLVFAVEGAVRSVMRPKKINLAALGNQVPHIHWHVIPRFEDDAFFPWIGLVQSPTRCVRCRFKNSPPGCIGVAAGYSCCSCHAILN